MSNYKEKTFTIREVDLNSFFDYECSTCGGVFAIDPCEESIKFEHRHDQARAFAIFYCPYCGKKNSRCW